MFPKGQQAPLRICLNLTTLRPVWIGSPGERRADMAPAYVPEFITSAEKSRCLRLQISPEYTYKTMENFNPKRRPNFETLHVDHRS
jgi:hypothetical protein